MSLCIQGLVAKTEGKSPAGRPRHRWGIILKCIFRKYETGINSFRSIKKGGGLL